MPKLLTPNTHMEEPQKNWWFCGFHMARDTPPKTNIAPENRLSQKETSIPTIHFQVQTVSFWEGIFRFPAICFCSKWLGPPVSLPESLDFQEVRDQINAEIRRFQEKATQQGIGFF